MLALCAALSLPPACTAAERLQLRNGFSLECDHHLPAGAGRVRVYLDAVSSMDMDAAAIVAVESVLPQPSSPPVTSGTPPAAKPLATLIADAGTVRNINLDLLRSVIDAESGGRTRAVSRSGARGLMQLTPATARELGVHDSFAPEDNLRGGTAYLDRLLTRYHNDLVLALAAYNAGPAAVDRYHGVPPYRETVAYVSRIVREFNRRTLQQKTASRQAALLGTRLP